MKTPRALFVVAAGAALAAGIVGVRVLAQAPGDAPSGTPAASIDLGTREGVALVRGAWRFKECTIKPVTHQGKPTYDYEPHAEGPNGTGAAGPNFDDSGWELVDPTTLKNPRGGGKVSFAWYRIAVTIPERIGNFDPTGSTVVFETTVDDYGEIWVNGQLPRRLGQTGGTVAAGFNVPNRLVIARDVRPGQKIQLAVFGINSPISASPGNFIFLRTDGQAGPYRYATKLDFYK